MRWAIVILATCAGLTGACSSGERVHEGGEDAPAIPAAKHDFQLTSATLSEFWGHPVLIEAIVLEPPRRSGDERLPISFYIHGFDLWPDESDFFANATLERLNAPDSDYPRMIYVFPRAQFAQGHHQFADSANNGPWGSAFVKEFIPAVESKFGAFATPETRFVSGHSSGGWAALWLQIAYPDTFGGVWCASPDPVDFRDFTGINVYDDANMYVDANGKERPLSRKGRFSQTVREMAEEEVATQPVGGQFYSFDAVLGPRGADGNPVFIFDRETGRIDHTVAEQWKQHDISYILRTRWAELGPKLAGKLHIYCGEEDTYRLEGAVRLLKDELTTLGSDADVVLIPGMGHGSLSPSEHWPNGWHEMAHRGMMARLYARPAVR